VLLKTSKVKEVEEQSSFFQFIISNHTLQSGRVSRKITPRKVTVCGIVVQRNLLLVESDAKSQLILALSPPVPDVLPNASNIYILVLTCKKVC
jgi:hypothetical protein